jgi:uncharacterized damage-inducible protein DinB
MTKPEAELRRLDDQLCRSFEGPSWHGPSVLEALAGLTPEQASSRPIDGSHTIWELAAHLTGTYRLVLRRTSGDVTPLSEADDWPRLPAATEENWKGAIEALCGLNRELRHAVLSFPAERLDEPLVSSPSFTAFTQFIGVTQHDLYHAGQIVMLKRALGVRVAAWPDARELEDLVEGFCARTLPKIQWTHAAHLAVGAWHVKRHGGLEALDLLRSRITKLNESHGVVNDDGGGYHETITCAYVAVLHHFLRANPDVPIEWAVQVVLAGPLASRNALFHYYSKERLMSVPARRGWLEPDIAPLPSEEGRRE